MSTFQVLNVSLTTLTVDQLLEIARRSMSVPLNLRRNKRSLVDYLQTHATAEVLGQLQQAADAAATAQWHTREERKRRRAEEREAEMREQALRRRLEEEAPGNGNEDDARGDAVDAGGEASGLEDDREQEQEPALYPSYLELPTEEEVRGCYREFYEATSNVALAYGTCAVCARETEAVGGGLRQLRLSEIPQPSRLHPRTPHPAHTLFQGMLLEPAGVLGTCSLGVEIQACWQCFEELRKDSALPPRLSLANNMWIGRVPPELERLTIPEQLLIALLYPRMYVFKLYPRVGAVSADPATLQRALRGTVSTYELDLEGAAAMLQGHLMPRLPSVLAELITVTFVGSRKLPKSWLRTTFRVRRRCVAAALRWLRRNNPKYYGNIDISEQRLALLPEDDVPIEILHNVRQNPDDGLVDQEAAGYVPDHVADADDEAPLDSGSGELLDGDRDGNGAEVIPLETSGCIDTDVTRATAYDLMIRGMANLWNEGEEGAYLIRHSRRPIPDFVGINPGEVFEKAFPCLFPYGVGGIDAPRLVRVDFLTHVQWALKYFDRRFRKHEHFSFYCFGIHQRHQALTSARVQMRQERFERNAHAMSAITIDALRVAQREEENNLPISDPNIRVLRQQVQATAGRVQGSDQSRIALRSQIWSTVLYYGPPTLWITINPNDLHDPIAQVFAGERIDLDAFVETAGPDAEQRARNIASDPYAAAKYFRFMVDTIFHTLFRIRVTKDRLSSEMGILGRVAAYIGSVECQGRGTLHLHTLLWLKDTPSPDDMVECLRQPSFRRRVQAYIAANLRAYVPGLESGESIRAIPVEKDIGYSRPPHPDRPDYAEALARFELRLARTEQIHSCRQRRCLVLREGVWRCKRRAPFPKAEADFIKESGEWGPRRSYEYVNGWVPGILVNARCNNDGKLLTHGRDTRNITFYVSMYAAKKQGRHYNMSAIYTNTFAYHDAHPSERYGRDLRESHRLLIFRIVQAINREQVLPGVMVTMYLMGHTDALKSHVHTTIFWKSFVRALLRCFPALRLVAGEEDGQVPPPRGVRPAGEHDAAQQLTGSHREGNSESVMLDIDGWGRLFARSQVNDYCLRGQRLSAMNILDFFMHTYEEKIDHTCRHTNDREEYLPEHPKAGEVWRVLRAAGHRNLPNIVAGWLPRRDDPAVWPFYCASALMLLKPWRNLETDLKREEQTWSEAFEEFMAGAPPEARFILAGFQYYHDCKTSADSEFPAAAGPGNLREVSPAAGVGVDDDGEDVEEGMYTAAGLALVKGMQVSEREARHAFMAIEWARRAGIFSDDQSHWAVSDVAFGSPASQEDLRMLVEWKGRMREDVERQNERQNFGVHQDEAAHIGRLEELVADEEGVAQVTAMAEEALAPLDVDELLDDQYRAYDIITWHLQRTLAGEDPDPLRMILYGEGGTGKSKVIQTVTEEFRRHDASFMLVKTAYTGVAASLIDGKTTHVVGQLKVGRRGRLTAESRRALQEYWRDRRYLIIDEYSMIAKSILAELERNINIGKQGSDHYKARTFGGVNVILCGDLHQFPPVARGRREALFYPGDPAVDTPDQLAGRHLYEECTTVVILKEQMRVTDEIWRDFLHHLRYGRVEDRHIAMLRELIAANEEPGETQFDQDPWSSASLVTPRHAVRIKWNEQSMEKWCRSQGARLFVVHAEDTIGRRPLTTREQIALAAREPTAHRRQRKDLPEEVHLAKGMKVMVTTNLETDLDLANGSRGEIVDVVLHPEEPPLGDNAVVHLKYLPSYVLVKLSRTRARKLPGLDEGVVPIEPADTTMQITLDGREGSSVVHRTVHRRQFPVTAAYAFTDYRSQGQTIRHAFVDIAKPPTGKLTLFNMYVALSRSSGRSTIRLLRDMDEEALKQAHVPELLAEDERLEELNEATRAEWLRAGRGRVRR